MNEREALVFHPGPEVIGGGAEVVESYGFDALGGCAAAAVGHTFAFLKGRCPCECAGYLDHCLSSLEGCDESDGEAASVTESLDGELEWGRRCRAAEEMRLK